MPVALHDRMRRAPLLGIFVLAADVLTPGPPASAGDFATACEAFGSAAAEVVFVGRAEAPVTRRVTSGESEIEDARKNLARAEAELRRVRSSDAQTRQERELDAYVKRIGADAEVKQLQAMFPPPVNAVLTPMHVETAFRGVTASDVFLYLGPQPPLEPGQSYLVFGRRLIPFVQDVVAASGPPRDVDSAQESLRFLSLAASGIHGTAVYGALRLEDLDAPNGPGQPMGGVNIRFSSGARMVEAVTKNDGSFVVTDLPAGTLEIEPSLPDHLTIGGRSSLKRELMEGGCAPVYLQAVLNGRLRGTVFGERGIPLKRGEVNLIATDPRRANTTRGRFDARTNDSGEFEFSGVPPGDYWLGVDLLQPSPIGSTRPPTYFPGTIDRDAAVPISVGQGTEQDGLSFSVTPVARESPD
jgi:hypothetical protein